MWPSIYCYRPSTRISIVLDDPKAARCLHCTDWSIVVRQDCRLLISGWRRDALLDRQLLRHPSLAASLEGKGWPSNCSLLWAKDRRRLETEVWNAACRCWLCHLLQPPVDQWVDILHKTTDRKSEGNTHCDSSLVN